MEKTQIQGEFGFIFSAIYSRVVSPEFEPTGGEQAEKHGEEMEGTGWGIMYGSGKGTLQNKWWLVKKKKKGKPAKK